jgi:hypothetical protein
MKNNLLAVLLIAAFSLFASGQNTQAPLLALHPQPDASQSVVTPGNAGVPNLCKPCVFYGGDFNMNLANSGAFANINSLLVPNTATYAAVNVPKTVHGVITGILFMQIASNGGNIFDPDTATYDIRTGVSGGNGGTSVTNGSAPLSAQVYGQCNCVEFETAVQLTKPLTVTPGTRYWFNLLTQCTDQSNPNCTELEIFFANTINKANGLNAGAQPAGQMFFNSAYFGFTWTNWCDPSLGQNAQECAFGSFGLMGHS